MRDALSAAALSGPVRRLVATILFPVVPLFVAPGSAVSGQQLDPAIQELMAQVSEESLMRLLTTLEGFETRHTLSDTVSSTRGIGAARRWIAQEFESYSPRLQVSFDRYLVPPQGRVTREAEVVNVKAVLPGRSARRVYVSGHFDSLARDEGAGGFDWTVTDNFAPGANDDGSGTVLTMELARVLAGSGLEFDATLVFIAFAGEELGLVGARLHAQRAEREGLRIDAVFNNDIVGNILGGDGVVDGHSVRVFSEGPEDSPSRQIARYIKRFSPLYLPSHNIRLIAREDRFGRGGDHTALNQLGFPGVRFTEARENYARQHTILDTSDGVDWRYLAQNSRANLASVASVALAPPAPEVNTPQGIPRLGRGETGYDATLEWDASPGAVGYRVFWRDTWSMDWEHEVLVGNVTRFALPSLSVDDHVFGVAAVGPRGHESLVSAYVRPPRANTPVEEIR